MSRRVSLPGADELFRTTGGTSLTSSSPRRSTTGEPRVPAPAGESAPTEEPTASGQPGLPGQAPRPAQEGTAGGSAEHTATSAESGSREHRSRTQEAEPAKRRMSQDGAATGSPQQPGRPAGNNSASAAARRRARAAGRRPSGRERHDEKITVYVSAEELMDLEHARLVLRGEHGLAVDRGRIVREAVAVVLADLESRGDASILVRRLRGR
ncbi:hypothetical protein [Streptomyces tsukubensis]|uniref:Cobyrinic acid a,c-diamide synthase n=1 Tax=Streptomyces tsukubensis TaxID=83656 RepID=A0A1V4AEH5_9ACTN|nr:hypothetical protein [Streptomyces tsukubensis]OON82375.1 hypothetical protein B1H18_05050 [Streptomyces tsukubensis]QFR92875.1 hypothetical protein GBW32_07075 [Streptomyces tsukubensis]